MRSRTRTAKPALRLLAPRPFDEVRRGYGGMMECIKQTDPTLCSVMRYVLRHPGSLVRAQLAYGILTEHRVRQESALKIAVGLEYFHTASLVFDDMPSMDDAMERRGSPCVHVKFGEAMATLGALAFINRAYTLIWDVIGQLPEAERAAASNLITDCLGLHGILNGQALDLHFGRGHRKEKDVLAVAMGKTVTLIRLTLLLPAIVAGVPARTRAKLNRLATLWGLGYQVMDDFKDALMTESEAGKTVKRDQHLARPSLPVAVGNKKAFRRLTSLLNEARDLVDDLTAAHKAWLPFARLQTLLEAQLERIQGRIASVSV
jgi:geranylgeranyl diphosphate synthase type II